MDYGEPRYGLSKRGGRLILWNSRTQEGVCYKFSHCSGVEPSRWYCYYCHAKKLSCRRLGQPCGSVCTVKVNYSSQYAEVSVQKKKDESLSRLQSEVSDDSNPRGPSKSSTDLPNHPHSRTFQIILPNHVLSFCCDNFDSVYYQVLLLHQVF